MSKIELIGRCLLKNVPRKLNTPYLNKKMLQSIVALQEGEALEFRIEKAYLINAIKKELKKEFPKNMYRVQQHQTKDDGLHVFIYPTGK